MALAVLIPATRFMWRGRTDESSASDLARTPVRWGEKRKMHMESCVHCRATPVTPPTCWRCGKNPHGGGGGLLALFAWLFIPFSIPVYPILGGLSTLAMIAVGWLTAAIAVFGGFRIIAIAAVGYGAMYMLAPLERAASRSRAYRTLRTAVRVASCAVLIIALLNAPAGDISPANALALAVIGVPLLFFIARRFDRVLGFGGPPKITSVADSVAPAAAGTTAPDPDKPEQEPDSGFRVEWRDAAFMGLIPAFIGFFIGREGGLFLGAFFWLATVAIIVGWRLLRRGVTRVVSGVGSSAPAKRGFGGMLRTVILGAVIGTAAGAVLLATSGSGRVEMTDVVAFTIVGSVVAGIIALVRRAFAAR
jgi:hypothetical protein